MWGKQRESGETFAYQGLRNGGPARMRPRTGGTPATRCPQGLPGRPLEGRTCGAAAGGNQQMPENSARCWPRWIENSAKRVAVYPGAARSCATRGENQRKKCGCKWGPVLQHQRYIGPVVESRVQRSLLSGTLIPVACEPTTGWKETIQCGRLPAARLRRRVSAGHGGSGVLAVRHPDIRVHARFGASGGGAPGASGSAARRRKRCVSRAASSGRGTARSSTARRMARS